MLKGASHVKKQISGDISLEDDTLAIPKGTQRAGGSGGPNRSNQNEELQTVVDEQKQTEEFGSAFEKLGSMRQRDSRKTPAAEIAEAEANAETPELEPSTISSEEVPTPAGSGEAVPLVDDPGGDSIGEPQSADSVPLAQTTEEDQMGKAMEQLGSMATRDAKRQEKEPEPAAMLQESPPDVQTETSAAPQESDSEPAPPSGEPMGDVASSAVQTETGTSDEAPQSQREAVPQSSSDKTPPAQQPSRQPAKTMRRKGGAAPRKSNKTELYIKSIKSLQVLFGNQMWRGVIVDPEQDPKQLYTPRSAFEERFVEVEFRNAMKAATRVVAGFGGQIRELRFDERTIADAVGFPFPKVGGIENPDERQIAEKCDKKMSKRIEQFATSDEVKRLLMHTGSRLGTFVPGLEIIARIYLGLKKGGDMDPQVRANIQKDVVFKYQKAYFAEDAARKARNTALRFFFEHLIDYGLEVYKERKTTILETKTQEMDVENRLESLQEVCGNLAAERASKAVLSAAVIVELREHIRSAISDLRRGLIELIRPMG